MTNKLIFALTKEKKKQYNEYLIDKSYSGTWEDSLFDNFKGIVIQTQADLQGEEKTLPDGRKVSISSEKIESTKIPNIAAKYAGEKSILLCGEKMYAGLVLACKMENYLRKKDRAETVSFAQFVNNIANSVINTAILQGLNQELDAERKQIKSETPNKAKK